MPYLPRTKAQRRNLPSSHTRHLPSDQENSYSRHRRNDFAARRRLDSSHVLYLDPHDRNSYKHERKYNAFRLSTFRDRKNSFINANSLPLNSHYDSELPFPHVYPSQRHGTKLVKYMDEGERNASMNKLTGGVAQNHDVSTLQGTEDLAGKNVIFTRRGSVDNLMMMKKHEIPPTQAYSRHHQTLGMFPQKSNHSSFNQGQAVANAGFLRFDRNHKLQSVALNSGHYQPGKESGVALAMWADKTGSFDPNQVPIRTRNNSVVDVSNENRVNTVNSWAQQHPKNH